MTKILSGSSAKSSSSVMNSKRLSFLRQWALYYSDRHLRLPIPQAYPGCGPLATTLVANYSLGLHAFL